MSLQSPKTRLSIRILVLAQAVGAVVLLAAGPAAAQFSPDPVGLPGAPSAPAPVADGALSATDWVLFAVMLVIALVVGAALAALARRLREGHIAGHRTA
ncbi:MAG TPA: hypothetical protein VFJ19_18470 [Nocardioidaceae bacterium]|nr:hypothetical protein [Nocardioidaceae bacterium]